MESSQYGIFIVFVPICISSVDCILLNQDLSIICRILPTYTLWRLLQGCLFKIVLAYTSTMYGHCFFLFHLDQGLEIFGKLR
jgi:hypothetical protein